MIISRFETLNSSYLVLVLVYDFKMIFTLKILKFFQHLLQNYNMCP